MAELAEITINEEHTAHFSVEWNNAAVTGLLDGNFTKTLYYNGVLSGLSLTFTDEVEDGGYSYKFTPDALGTYLLVIKNNDGYFSPTGKKGQYICREAVTDAVWDELLTAATHNIPTSAGRRLRQVAGTVVVEGEVVSSTINTVSFNGDASAVDGAYDPSIITIIDGTGSGQSRLILEYFGATKTAVIDRNWKVNPDVTSKFVIYADPGREHVNEGLAQAGSNTTITLNALASSADNAYVNQTVFIRSGTGDDQARLVIAYDGTTKIATVDREWDTNPDVTSAYVMIPIHIQLISEVVDAIWDEPVAGHTTADTYGKYVSDILEDTGTTLPAQITSVHSTTDGLLVTLQGDVTAIKAKTDNMPADLATEITAIQLALTQMLGIVGNNFYIDEIVRDDNNNITSYRLRVYSDSVSVGTALNVILTLTVSGTFSGVTGYLTILQGTGA